jgi:hypothetical protein
MSDGHSCPSFVQYSYNGQQGERNRARHEFRRHGMADATYEAAGNMIGMLKPPATTTGATPAWVPMTEAQWNTLA